MRRCHLFVLLCALLLPSLVRGEQPDRHGEVVTSEPRYRGVDVRAPIPIEMRVRNEGGSDGAGLCVISSILADGMHQGVPGLDVPGVDEWTRKQVLGKGSALWLAAKDAAGGYSPSKLSALLARVMPQEQYVSYLGDDYSMLVELSRKGYAIGVTMNTSSLYQYQPIAHMVSGVHFDDTWACIVDNNDPGHFYWMPRAEFMRRWKTHGVGWAHWWLRLPATTPDSLGELFWCAAAVVLLMQSAILLLVVAIRRSPATPARKMDPGSDPLFAMRE